MGMKHMNVPNSFIFQAPIFSAISMMQRNRFIETEKVKFPKKYHAYGLHGFSKMVKAIEVEKEEDSLSNH